jgi:hypothetical protein
MMQPISLSILELYDDAFPSFDECCRGENADVRIVVVRTEPSHNDDPQPEGIAIDAA